MRRINITFAFLSLCNIMIQAASCRRQKKADINKASGYWTEYA
jgi:hypothetical protein